MCLSGRLLSILSLLSLSLSFKDCREWKEVSERLNSFRHSPPLSPHYHHQLVLSLSTKSLLKYFLSVPLECVFHMPLKLSTSRGIYTLAALVSASCINCIAYYCRMGSDRVTIDDELRLRKEIYMPYLKVLCRDGKPQ